MSPSQSKCWYSKNCLHFLKCAVPLVGVEQGELDFTLENVLYNTNTWIWLKWGSVTHQMAVPVPHISCCVLNHHNLFYQIQNALAFNWDTCCHIALCLQLLPFHCDMIIDIEGAKIDCLSLFMCPLLAQCKIGFFSFFFCCGRLHY